MMGRSIPAEPREQALDTFWDAVVEHLPADSLRLTLVDASDARAIRRIHALAPEALPSPVFSDRLLNNLLGQLNDAPSIPAETGSAEPRMEDRTMHAIALDAPSVSKQRYSRKRGRWSHRLELAAAVLLIFGFAAFAIRQLPDPPSGTVTSIPAVVQTDNATPQPAGGDVPMNRGNPGRTGQMPGPGPSGEPITLWQFSTGGSIESAAAVVNDSVVIGSKDGTLYALDATSGDEHWAFAAGSPVDGSPSIADGMVYVGTQNGTIYAVDLATGAKLWEFSGTREGTSPLVADGMVLVGSWDGNTLYALDAKTGTQRWALEAGAPFIRIGAYADGTVYYPSREGVLHAVDAATGTERWSFTMDTPVDVDSPVVLDGVVYQPTYQSGSTLYAIDAATGTERWRYNQPQGFRSPAVDAQTIYLSGMGGNVYALDRQDGAERWIAPIPGPLAAPPSLSDGVLYVGGQNATLYALDAASGAERWRFAVDQAIERNPTVAGGVIYVGTTAGSIYAIGGNTAGETTPVAMVAATPPNATFDPAAVQVIWQSTGGPTAFAAPIGIAEASTGDLYVGDTRNNQIQIIRAEDGAFVGLLSGDDGEPAQFTFTGNFGYDASLGFDSAGNLYVFDFNSNLVQKFDPQGNLLQTWGSEGTGNRQFQLPKGYVDAANDRIYVADIINNRVQVFDPDGNFLDKWGGFGSLPGQFNEPNSVTVGPDGSVYVSEYSGGRIQKFDSDGVYLGTIGTPGSGPGELSQPSGMAIDAAGNLVVADFANGRLQIFRPDGTVIGSIAQLPGYTDRLAPSSVMFDSAGNLYISDEASNSVYKLQLPPLE